MAWNPAPVIGSAFWGGNPQLVTKRQFLSSISSIESLVSTNNNGDNAKFSTLYVSTITSIDAQSVLNILNLSSILVSTFRNVVVNSENVQTTAKINNYNFLNGQYANFNRDPVTNLYDPVINKTDLLTGSGSFQALTGALTIAATTSTLNLYAGNDGMNISGDARFLTGYLDMLNHGISSVSNLTVTNSDIKSISSLRISTGTARVGTADIGTLTVGGVTLSGNLDMGNNNISNVNTLTATSITATGVGATTVNAVNANITNIAGTLTGNVVGNISNVNLTVLGQYSITETADVGSALSNYASYGTVNITGKGGLGGIVNITADVATPLNPAVTVSQLTAEAKGNYGLISPAPAPALFGYIPRGGLVSIIARQGLTPTPPAVVTSQLFGNGEIDLTAYSYGVVPGLIKLNSGANAMYAGAISPLTGIFGNNYIFGQYGNSILAALPPGGVPNVPGENYIYGLTGTVIDNGLYTDTIYNKFGGNLNLDSRTSNISITSSNTGGTLSLTSPTITLTGSSAINLTGNATISGNLNMTDGTISNVGIMSATSGSNMTIQNQESFLFFPTTALIYATGGTITESGGRTFHTFTTNGTFTLNYSVGTIEVALIGGGGGGGGVNGGGGGAGNAIIATSTLTPDTYTVTIGAGGAGGTASSIGGNGTQSRFANGSSSVNVRALGGGGGATTGVGGGANGGCGGGGAEGTESLGGSAGPGVITGMTGVFNSATSGGFNPNPANTGTAGSGGGGTQSIGQNVSAITPSDGGDGGTATLYYGTYYGGGGGGSAAPTGVYGAPKKGRGGGTAPPTSGGNGSLGATTTQAEVGVANTGGGGGGGEDATGGYPGAAGGSGIVIVSYLTPPNERFTMGTSEEILLSSVKVTVSNDLTVLGTTNIQTTTVSTITVTNLSTIGTATFGGDVYMTGPSTVISKLFISDTNQIETFVMVQGGTTNLGSYSINSPQNNVSYNGQQFPVSDWNCSASLAGFSIPQPYATNQAYVVATNVGGFWNIQSYMGLATLPGGGVGVQWTIRLVMTPRGIAGPNQLSAEAPSTLSTSGLALNIPLTFMSSITASTITMEAIRNISILANIAPPSYISSGSITIAGTNDVDVLGNVVALGGVTDVDIEALTGDVNIDAASEITLTAPFVDIVGARTLSALSTQQIAIQQTAGSDFVLFNNGDTRMRAVRDAYVEGVRDTYLLANQNMNVRAPNTQYITIQQTGLANDSFIQFQPSGVIDQFSRLNMSIRTLSTNYITIEQQGAGTQSHLHLIPNGVVDLTGRLAIDIHASNSIFLDAPTTYVAGNFQMNASNAYIANLGHIYGNASAPGGGLAIDSMYGLFFNSSGKNANLYADAGNLNMINYNSGINIANYNSNGTGNFSLYSASNDMYLTSGTGRDIIINGGRTVSINAAQPGGYFGIYTSTINAGTLVDMNFNCGGNYSVTGGGASQYITFQNAGTYIQFAGSNIYFGSAGGGLSFNLPVSIGASYSLNLQNAPLSNLSNAFGTDIAITGTNTVSINAPYTTLTGSSNFNILGNNIGITSSNAFDIVATGSGVILDGEFKRKLASTNIPQPIIQYGEDNTGSGSSGSVVITLPVAYPLASSYVAFATMEDSDPAEMSVVRNTASEIEIFWQQGSGGSHVIVWQTIGK